jgi:putative phosphoribosyl transferase
MTLFRDRTDAARQLLRKLQKYRDQDPLVLGIPRGAVPMAEIVAEGLGGELGAVLVHKIPAPGNEEFAIGSIGLSGQVHRNHDFEGLGICDRYFEQAASTQLKHLRERQSKLGIPDLECAGRTVILVDDGIATGATALAAVREIRSSAPSMLVLAAPVVAQEAASLLRPLVDELVTLAEPELFWAVGQFYSDFSQVSDAEVRRIFAKRRCA